jgi:excisionase family DNA binding protein
MPSLLPNHPADRKEESLTTSSATDDRMWTVEELSTFLGIPVGTLYRWRRYRCGPPGHKVGRHLRYLREEVIAWLRDQP